MSPIGELNVLKYIQMFAQYLAWAFRRSKGENYRVYTFVKTHFCSVCLTLIPSFSKEIEIFICYFKQFFTISFIFFVFCSLISFSCFSSDSKEFSHSLKKLIVKNESPNHSILNKLPWINMETFVFCVAKI